MFELAFIKKSGGPLTKRISLDTDGAIKSDGSACVMPSGVASRLKLANVDALADAINTFEPCNAVTLGRLRAGLPDAIRVLTKARVNDNTDPHIIARTAEAFVYEAGKPALTLLDYDTKGMPGMRLSSELKLSAASRRRLARCCLSYSRRSD